jgi:hypothetical protein
MTQQISVSNSRSVISTKYYGENPPQVGETYKSKEGVIYTVCSVGKGRIKFFTDPSYNHDLDYSVELRCNEYYNNLTRVINPSEITEIREKTHNYLLDMGCEFSVVLYEEPCKVIVKESKYNYCLIYNFNDCIFHFSPINKFYNHYPWVEELECYSFKSNDEKLDILFANIDDLLLANSYENVNDILLCIDIEGFSTDITIGFLSITLQAKDKLPARKLFYSKVKGWLEMNEPGRVYKLLEGLE